MTRSERACQIWAVLAWMARNRQSVIYSQLESITGAHREGFGQLLEPIQSYCMIHGLPPLTVLVVQQEWQRVQRLDGRRSRQGTNGGIRYRLAYTR